MVRVSGPIINRRQRTRPTGGVSPETFRSMSPRQRQTEMRRLERNLGRVEGRREQQVLNAPLLRRARDAQRGSSGTSAVKVKELMNNHIAIRRKHNKDLPRHNTTNVADYFNNSFINTNATNIPKNRRVFISKDLVGNKVKQVYNQEGIIKLLMESKNLVGKSPITRRNFELKHVIPYEEKLMIRPTPRSRRK